MKIKKQFNMAASLIAALFLGSCSQSEDPPISQALAAQVGKTLTFDVWFCNTVSANTNTPLGTQDIPAKDCGDFAVANGRLPRQGEPGFAETSKAGQIRVKMEATDTKITDLLIGADSSLVNANKFNGVLGPIIRNLATNALDTKDLHSLKKATTEDGRGAFSIAPISGDYLAKDAKFESYHAGNAGRVVLKLGTTPGYRQMLRFSLEAGDEPSFEIATQMKEVDPSNASNPQLAYLAQIALPAIEQAGASGKVALLAMSVGMLAEVTKDYDENLLKNFASLGGPEFRFASSD